MKSLRGYSGNKLSVCMIKAGTFGAALLVCASITHADGGSRSVSRAVAGRA